MRNGLLIYTYDRVDDARVNMEIAREMWAGEPDLRDLSIVHAFNGNASWWPESYLEDRLLYLPNTGHFTGAETLLNSGIQCFIENYPDIDYVIVAASDTWCVKPEFLSRVIADMRKQGKYLATCTWGDEQHSDLFKDGMAVDFFILDLRWAARAGFFPLRFSEFVEKYSEILSYQDMTAMLEGVFALRFRQAVEKTSRLRSEDEIKTSALSRVYRIAEREPIHIMYRRHFWKRAWKERVMYWPKIGLITHHDAVEKQQVLRKWPVRVGPHGQRFLSASDLSYFNNVSAAPVAV